VAFDLLVNQGDFLKEKAQLKERNVILKKIVPLLQSYEDFITWSIPFATMS